MDQIKVKNFVKINTAFKLSINLLIQLTQKFSIQLLINL